MDFEYVGSGIIGFDTQAETESVLTIVVFEKAKSFRIEKRVFDITTPEQVYSYFSSRLKAVLSSNLCPLLLFIKLITLGDSSYENLS